VGDRYGRSNASATAAWEKAVLDCNEALRLAPNNALVYETRCQAHYNLGLPDKAIADSDELIRLEPRNSKGYQVRGLARIAKGNAKEALEDFTQAIQLNPQDITSLRERGIAYFCQQNYKPAADDLTAAIDIHQAAFKFPDTDALFYRALFYRGWSYNFTRNYDAAIADFTVVIKAQPKFAKAYYLRSFAYKAKGDLLKFKSDYSRAIKLDPNVAKE
jgi:tetratricopeptide (TPR) repeat protein